MTAVVDALEEAGGAMEERNLRERVEQERIDRAVERGRVTRYRFGRRHVIVLSDYV